MFFDQHEFDIRCEWGLAGLTALLPTSDVFIIVDVLSFSTSVDLAVGNGALVYPYRWKDESAVAYAQERGAILASFDRRATASYSLAPSSLVAIPAGARLVLPSPNGSTLSTATETTLTFAGCLRNARAVARAAQRRGRRISVIAAGERWSDGSLRPAIEDLLGAGAIVAQLSGSRSPEATVAEQAFLSLQANLSAYLRQCSSGKELIERDMADDVELAAALNQSDAAPLLQDGAYAAADG
jgi:2-phosphosulfolactate phosphatase